MKAVEKEKNELEDVRNEAIEFLTAKNEVTQKQNLLYHFVLTNDYFFNFSF